jgi:hypothetical protein
VPPWDVARDEVRGAVFDDSLPHSELTLR